MGAALRGSHSVRTRETRNVPQAAPPEDVYRSDPQDELEKDSNRIGGSIGYPHSHRSS